MKEQELTYIKKELSITIVDEVNDYLSNLFSYLIEKWSFLGSSESVKSDVINNGGDKNFKNESSQKTVKMLIKSTDLATSGLQKATFKASQTFGLVGEFLIGNVIAQNSTKNLKTSREPTFVVGFEEKSNTVESKSVIPDSNVNNEGGTKDFSHLD